MNTLDNLLLFVVVAVFIIYCYKKKKLFFSRPCKEEKTENEEQKTAQGIQTPAQIIPFCPQIYQQSIQTPVNSLNRSTFCKLISTDNSVIDDDADLENVVNNELVKLNASGYIIQNVNAVSFDLFDSTGRICILFCITYGR